MLKTLSFGLNFVETYRQESSVNIYRMRRCCLPLTLVLFTDRPEQTNACIQFIAICLFATQTLDALSRVANC